MPATTVMRQHIAILFLVGGLPLISGGTLSSACRSQLTTLPSGIDRCSSHDVSEIWVAGACVDRVGLVSEGKILLSDDFASALSGDGQAAQTKCTALCKQEAAPLGWQPCADEGKECACRGTVRFGATSSWLEKYVDGSISCASEAFGEVYGEKIKKCQCRPMYTGCELVASTESDKGCYVHTATSVFKGSGATNAQCWTRTRSLSIYVSCLSGRKCHPTCLYVVRSTCTVPGNCDSCFDSRALRILI